MYHTNTNSTFFFFSSYPKSYRKLNLSSEEKYTRLFVGTNVKEGSISRNDIIFTYFYIFPAYFHPFFSLLKKEKIVIQNVKK